MRAAWTAILAAGLSAGFHAGPAMAHGALSDRIAILGDQIKGHPKDVVLRLERAELLRQDEAFDAALADLAEAQALDAKAVAYPLLKAQVLVDAKRFAEAARVVGPLAKANPKHGPAWWLLGLSRLRAGDAAGACAALDRAAALLDPLQPDHVLVQTEAFAAAKRPEEALKRLDVGIAKLGVLPALVERAVALEVALGRQDAARRRLDGVVADWKARGLKADRWEELRKGMGK